jgi:hypothetical protein
MAAVSMDTRACMQCGLWLALSYEACGRDDDALQLYLRLESHPIPVRRLARFCSPHLLLSAVVLTARCERANGALCMYCGSVTDAKLDGPLGLCRSNRTNASGARQMSSTYGSNSDSIPRRC